MTTQPLVVPIHLDALCVGDDDSVSRFTSFATPSADFSMLPYQHANSADDLEPFLSSEAMYEPFQTAAFMDSGVHLHWQLPKALTHGEVRYQLSSAVWLALENQGFPSSVATSLQGNNALSDTAKQWTESALRQALQAALPTNLAEASSAWYQTWILRVAAQLSFPALPDRWLVMRLTEGGSSPPTAWVIESDYVTTTAWATASPSIPSPCSLADDAASFRPHYRNLGLSLSWDRWYEDTSLDGPCADEGCWQQLTALGYGDPTFAAYYPNCRNVFGVHDAMSDIDDENFTYAVVGWYSRAQQDPVSSAVNVLDALVANGWTLPGVSSNSPLSGKSALSTLDSTLFCGIVRNVQWDSSQQYVDGDPDLTSNQVTVSFAETPAEALATYLAQGKTSNDDLTPAEKFAALQLGVLGRVDNGPDGVSRVQQAMHRSRFSAVDGGERWQVTVAEDATDATTVDLPASVATALNALNVHQQTYHRLQDQLASRRDQLFADWCTFMTWRYPTHASGYDTLYDILTQAITDLNTPVTQVQTVLANILNTLDPTKSTLPAALGQKYQLELTPTERFWQPNEPSILCVGSGVKASSRATLPRDATGDLVCAPLSSLVTTAPNASIQLDEDQVPSLSSSTLENLNKLLALLENNAGSTTALHHDSWGDQNPWYPMLLQWRVKFNPLKDLSLQGGSYPTNFVESRTTLPGNETELLYNTSKTKPAIASLDTMAAWRYQGTVVLSPRALTTLKGQAAHYFSDPTADPQLKSWIDAIGDDTAVLSQALGGFNDALVMRLRELQMPIYDPFVFPPSDPLVPAMRNAIGEHTVKSGLPFNTFNPVRAGFLTIEKLRVVDAFGQYRDIDCSQIKPLVPEALKPPTSCSTYNALLPPRLTQASRLRFDWLAASSDQIEMNSHPASTPVCGWLLPNHLDHSLVIYDSDGSLVGALRAAVGSAAPTWIPTPGAGASHTFINTHLENLVDAFGTYSGDEFIAFVLKMEELLVTVEPSTFRQHDAQAVFMGRPLAFVRASLQLELKGDPAYSQSSDAYDALLDSWNTESKIVRDDASFTAVSFPVRLGDQKVFDDGLVGYFIENSSGGSASDYTKNDFVAADVATTPLNLSCGGAAKTVAMMVDPRAKVHATTGILPMNGLEIPPDQYVEALKSMEFAFLINPVLSPVDQLRLPLPAEGGLQWSWVASGAASVQTDIRPPDETARASYSPQSIREGWLQARPFS